jgi:hypothetical protein
MELAAFRCGIRFNSLKEIARNIPVAERFVLSLLFAKTLRQTQ